MIIHRKSPVTGKMNAMNINVTPEQLQIWEAGALIQNVMPHLTPAEREFIISGCTQDDWDYLWKETEEDED